MNDTEQTTEEENHNPEEGKPSVSQEQAASGSVNVESPQKPGRSGFSAFLGKIGQLIARGFKYLFGTETKVGRFNRLALRWLAGIIGVFALGLLTAYFFLYRPAYTQLYQARLDLQTAQGRITDLDAQLKLANQNLTSSEQQSKTLQKSVQDVNDHLLLVRAQREVQTARLALTTKDITLAHQSLKNVQTVLDGISAPTQTASSSALQDISNRLSLAVSELERDSKTAASDLEILNRYLQDLEKSLYP